MTKTTHIGGTMYGDGEYVVTFRGGGTSLAPLSATILGGRDFFSYDRGECGDRPSVKLAATLIAEARRIDGGRS
jgi:hypothetical protein